MNTLLDFIQTAPDFGPREHPLLRMQQLAREAGMRSVARDLEEEIHQVEKGLLTTEPVFRAGQPIWWFPSSDNRPGFMTRTQVMIAGQVKSMNHERGTVLIEHLDERRRTVSFLVPANELVRRDIPR